MNWSGFEDPGHQKASDSLITIESVHQINRPRNGSMAPVSHRIFRRLSQHSLEFADRVSIQFAVVIDLGCEIVSFQYGVNLSFTAATYRPSVVQRKFFSSGLTLNLHGRNL
jgi:hypothetical protein